MEDTIYMYVQIQKSKSTEMIYIRKSVRKGSSVSKTVVEKLGRIDELMDSLHMTRDQVLEYARKRADELEKMERDENSNILLELSQNKQLIKDEQRRYCAGYLFLQDIFYDMKLNNMFRNLKSRHRYEYSLESIFTDLVYARIIDPSSKRSSYDTAKTFLEPPQYELHDVYRSLHILGEEMDYIQREIFRNSSYAVARDTSALYYDCTNYYFEIEDEDELRRYGKSKEHRPNPIVGMGLFMDNNGIPLAFNIFPGNRNEQPTLKETEKQIIREYGVERFVVCTDAGLSSKANKLFNTIQQRSFITTQSIKKLNEELKGMALGDEGWRRLSDRKKIKGLSEVRYSDSEEIYFKEFPSDNDMFEERIIVTYSPKHARYQKNIRDAQVRRAQSMISERNFKKQRRNPNDPGRFIGRVSSTKEGEVADRDHYMLDEDRIAEEELYDGFYGISTDLLDDDVSDIIAVCERRWEIEESFRIMKTDFRARPVYVSREDSIKAHFLICYTALLIYRILEKKLHEKYTTSQILKTIREYDLLKFPGRGYVPIFTRNEITDSLHAAFSFRTDVQILSTDKVRRIISETKK